ncbi:MAG TPA: hypothetical protein VMV86_03385 [Methanosarcinales archaeon]|nr:hypothetical protein [Methanosarcinales archaeon]
MNNEKVKTTTTSAIPSSNVTIFPFVTLENCMQNGEAIVITTDGTYEKCPHCGSFIMKITKQKK